MAAGLAYAWRGPEGAPTLILSAGLGGLGRYWAPNLPALSRDFRVLTYDHRGTGASEPAPPGDLRVEDMAGDLLALMDQLEIEQASLIGHALGAQIGLALALAAPARLDRLIAVNGWAALAPVTGRAFDVRLALLRDSGPEAFFLAQPLFLYPGTWISDHDAALRAEAVVQCAAYLGPEPIAQRIAAVRAFDPGARLAGVETPTLAVCAKDDLLVPWTASLHLAERLPRARVDALPWGGHACNVTDARAFDRVVLSWLSDAP